MKTKTRILWASLLVLLVFSFASATLIGETSVHALTCKDTQIDTVLPSQVVNDTATIITVTGTGWVFDLDSVVILEGYSTLATTYISQEVLTAVVPAGVPAGLYNVQVITSTSKCYVLTGGLRILAPTATPLPTNYVRPIVTVQSYAASSTTLYPGQEIDFEITLENTGTITAKNVIVTFNPGDLITRDTGGVRSAGDIASGGTSRFFQPFRVDTNISGYEAVIDIVISYTDDYGNSYEEVSTLSFEAGQYATAVPTSTPLPTLSVRPQLIIEGYTTSPDPIGPGMIVTLDLEIVNVSGEDARQVVVGLALSPTALSALAPVGGSNIRYIDQFPAGSRQSISYQLAVDGNFGGGLIPIDFEVSYMDDYNAQHTQSETISLSIISPTFLQVGLFDELPDEIVVGDVFDIPIEVINIGDNSINVSTIEVIADSHLQLTDNSLYIGPLDGGTSATLIAEASAVQEGEATVEVRVTYLDNFQQTKTYIHVMTLTIQPAPLVNFQDGDEGFSGDASIGSDDGSLTFGQRLWRGLLGFFGLGTRPASETIGGGR